ncbi:uncharacterized protein LOC129706143 [Leucoraja erinacea]|uniref:uncharacterized protein LOC129706143 n=1 Tax=Leucoraja erinaceus TaxID=7782 RepID=UPI00245880F8|nr:uncharacterized protein LOC129706143 [Leucoraja erinacea]
MQSCTHTNTTANPWWRVDLGRTFVIAAVRISNRLDCCRERILGAEVRIGISLEDDGNSNRLCGTVQSVKDMYTFMCDGFMGRYVNIRIPGTGKILTLCEVEVLGMRMPDMDKAGKCSECFVVMYTENRTIKSNLQPCGSVACELALVDECNIFGPTVNLAALGDATQSSDMEDASADRAIDNNKNTNALSGASCTETTRSDSPWWRLNLREIYAVSVIKITNRMDCCSERLKGAEIRIGNSLHNNGNSNSLQRVKGDESPRGTRNCRCWNLEQNTNDRSQETSVQEMDRQCFQSGVISDYGSDIVNLISSRCGIVNTSQQTIYVACQGMSGQYVNIIIPGSQLILTLCEVEVFSICVMESLIN